MQDLEKFTIEYQAGKVAFECGEYRQSVEHLLSAIAAVPKTSRRSGEAQMWLVTAYEAAGRRAEAISLCKQLMRHPDLDTRQQSKRLLYILEAPQLVRRPDWLTQIPDLGNLEDTPSKFSQASGSSNRRQPASDRYVPENVDLSQVNTQDNRFIWFALGAIALLLGALAWFSF